MQSFAIISSLTLISWKYKEKMKPRSQKMLIIGQMIDSEKRNDDHKLIYIELTSALYLGASF